MGTSADINGITLQFVNEKNEPAEPPIYGRYAHIRGVERSEALKYTTLAEGEEPGSEHWMTLLAVADTPERLDAIVNTATARKGSVNTSAASHRVLVAFHVGDRLQVVREPQRDCQRAHRENGSAGSQRRACEGAPREHARQAGAARRRKASLSTERARNRSRESLKG